MYTFKENKYVGTAPFASKPTDFEIVYNIPGYSDKFDNCVAKSAWNALYCQNKKIGILLFESEDEDKMDRSFVPLYVENPKYPGVSNKINSMMDHGWDGFYSSQKRMTRFPILTSGKTGNTYDIKFTGTPPKKMVFTFRNAYNEGGMIIRIAYVGSVSRAINKKGIEIPYNKWDDKIAGYGPVKGTSCGENRYDGIKNILEFYITAGCDLNIVPRDAIQTMVRMEWTVDEFFAEGGTTTFADRLAGSLGIHASTIKVVSVYMGSLVVNYEIAATKEEPLKLEEIAKIQTQKFATGKVSVGAPVLDVASVPAPSMVEKAKKEGKKLEEKPAKIISDGQVAAVGFEPKVLVKTATNMVGGCPSYSRKLGNICKTDTCTSSQKLLKNGVCEQCPDYYKANTGGRECELDTCEKNEYLHTDGNCKLCEDFKLASGELQVNGIKYKKECTTTICDEKRGTIRKDGQCQMCPDYTKPTKAKGGECLAEVCNDRQNLLADGTCKACGPFTRASEPGSKECKPDKCSSKAKLLEDGTCQVCPDFKSASEDGKSCVDPNCSDRAILTLDGICK